MTLALLARLQSVVTLALLAGSILGAGSVPVPVRPAQVIRAGHRSASLYLPCPLSSFTAPLLIADIQAHVKGGRYCFCRVAVVPDLVNGVYLTSTEV